MALPKRLCSHDGCDRCLNANNKSGLCKEHHHLGRTARDRSNDLQRERRRSESAATARATCSFESCEKSLPRHNKHGYCKDHLGASEAIKEYKRAWGEANRESRNRAARKSAAKRRTRRAGAVAEDVERQRVWERAGGVCYLCDKPCDPSDWHLEHVIPLARGGEHSYSNVAVAHPFCNLIKGTKLVPTRMIPVCCPNCGTWGEARMVASTATSAESEEEGPGLVFEGTFFVKHSCVEEETDG